MGRRKRPTEYGKGVGVRDQRGAALRLGCSVRTVRRLEADGVLKRAVGVDALGGGKLGRWYWVEELDALRRRRELSGKWGE